MAKKNRRATDVGDGSLQVVLAIASVTTLVTVDSTQNPPVISPEDLGMLTFNDPAVGMTDEQVAIFKANLAIMLPEIAVDIRRIPDNANQNIGDVAQFVQLALVAG
jgi:hypothetical protein